MPSKTDGNLATKTLRVRLKDRHAAFLRTQAREVNFVWNFVNDLSMQVLRREGRFASAYDLQKFTDGATKEGLSLHSQTVQAISGEYVTRRHQFKKRRLAWRVTSGARRSLGWIPVKASALRYRAGQVWYCGRPLSLWDSYGLAGYDLGAGSFSEDTRGRWYLNVTVQVKKKAPAEHALPSVGIDLGLRDFAATSEGETIETPRFYRDLEAQLAVAQRALKKARAAAIHAKIANRRKDFLHKLSTRLVRGHGAIFVGNVDASKLVKTRLAKSVSDAGWRVFRTMLRYKCDDAAVWFAEVNEAYSTQTCSACHARSGPRGLQGLGISSWRCVCGASHHRDVNAAKNILATGIKTLAGKLSRADESLARCAPGRGRLAGGIPAL